MLNFLSTGGRLSALCAFVAVLTSGAVGYARGTTPADGAAVVAVRETARSSAYDVAGWTVAERGGAALNVLSLALEAAGKAVARGDAVAPRTLTVIDFSRPSLEKRMWVYDLHSRKLLFHDYVAHGRGSGANMATQFSNVAESNESSLGLYRTAEAYVGKHGLSLRLDGLEPGVNDRARQRAIVIHGAEYVNGETARVQGRLGRSLGCPAVRPAIVKPLIEAVQGGSLVFAYYPEPTWLAGSVYLN